MKKQKLKQKIAKMLIVFFAISLIANVTNISPVFAAQPANDTIEIHIDTPGGAENYGMGVSNGDDTATTNYPDLNFDYDGVGSLTPFAGAIDNANAFAFANGEPTRTDETRAFDTLTWTNMLENNSGGLLTVHPNEYSTAIPLGFTVTIYGQDVDEVRIASNGKVFLNKSVGAGGPGVYDHGFTLDTEIPGTSMTDYLNADFPDTNVDGSGTGDILVAGPWNDIDEMHVSAADAYQYNSDSGNEVFVINFENLYDGSGNGPIDAQIKILGNGAAGDGGAGAGQNVAQQIGCPGASEYTFEISDTPDSVTFDSLAFDVNDATNSYDSVLNNDETIDDENLLTVTDTRSGGSADCPAASKGFTVTVEITTTLISSESHTIADSNFRAITSNELATQPPTGYEAWSDGEEIWYDDAEDATGNLWDIDAPFLYDDFARDDAVDYDKFNYEDAYKKTCGGGDSEGSCTGATFSNTLDAARTLLSTTTSHNTAFSTGVAVYGEIPAAQEPGTYTGTITYTLAAQ